MTLLHKVHRGGTWTEEEEDICFHAMWLWSDDGDDDEDMLFKVSCAAYFTFCCDDHHRAHTELCLTAATSLLLPLVPSDVPRKVMPENGPTVCITFTGHFPQAACRTYVKLWLLHRDTASVVNIYITKTHFQQVGFTWKCDANCWLHCLRANIALYQNSGLII